MTELFKKVFGNVCWLKFLILFDNLINIDLIY